MQCWVKPVTFGLVPWWWLLSLFSEEQVSSYWTIPLCGNAIPPENTFSRTYRNRNCYVQLYISHFLIKPGWSYRLGTVCNGGFLTEAVEGVESWIGKHEGKKRKASEEWLSGWNYPSHETYPHMCPTAVERRFALVRWAEEQLENHQSMPGSPEGS